MGYYVRAFCTAEKPPPVAEVLQWLESRGIHLEVAEDACVASLDSPDWEQVALVYKTGKMPILVDCDRDDGTEDSLVREEVDESIEFVEGAGASPAKDRVIGHLKATRFVVACRLSTSDIDDDGYAANSAFLAHFVENCGGMIQADGEGFYEGEELVVAIE